MNRLTDRKTTEAPVFGGPQSILERTLLEEYLQSKGYHLCDLDSLPDNVAKALMTEASQFASLKLAQVESTAHFREEIRRVI